MASQSIKKNIVYNAIKTLSSIIFPLITFPYISRVLLPENVGKINFGLSIISYFSLIATLGITTYAIRECSVVREDKEKLSNTASQIWSINIITTVVAYVALAVTLLFYNKLKNYRTLIVIQSLTIVATTLGADWINSAMEDFKYITIRTVAFQIVSLILMFIFVKKPEDYMKYAVISLVSSAGASIANIWYRRRFCNIRLINIHGIQWNHHLKPIFLLFVMILAQTLFNSIDVTMLGLIHGDHEVGIYSTGHRVSSIIMRVVTSIVWVVIPRLSNYLSERDYKDINALLTKLFGFFALIGLPIITGTIVVSRETISILAGKEYISAVPVLQILMCGYFFDLFGNSFIGNVICLSLKQEKKYTITWFFATLNNIVLNYFLIPKYGAIAAASTTALSYLFSLVVLIVYIDKKIRIESVFKMLLSPVVGCIGIIGMCLAAENISNTVLRLIVKIAGSVLVYTGVQYVMKNNLFIVELRNIISKANKKIN